MNYTSAWTDPKWFVLFVRSNQEKRVAEGLAHRDIEHYLPCYDSIHQWKDRRVRLQIPLFAGYVFVRLALVERGALFNIPNIVSLVGAKDCPSPISDEEIAWIRNGVENGAAKPWSEMSLGDWVVITAGALSGLEGTLIRRHGSARVVVSVQCISRSFVVDVDEAHICPASQLSSGRVS